MGKILIKHEYGKGLISTIYKEPISIARKQITLIQNGQKYE
jgi:hypothetical protein